MMKLIQNIDVYAPQHLGKKDVLTINDKIVKIKDAGSISEEGFLFETEIINGEGLLLTPGFIDCHVHVLGGGGEGGFANRTPEATMEGLTKFGTPISTRMPTQRIEVLTGLTWNRAPVMAEAPVTAS